MLRSSKEEEEEEEKRSRSKSDPTRAFAAKETEQRA
jgi:hypothetical protein